MRQPLKQIPIPSDDVYSMADVLEAKGSGYGDGYRGWLETKQQSLMGRYTS